ncbi:MAG: hypothetical protein V4557_17160 [Bacteroidota bacterium]
MFKILPVIFLCLLFNHLSAQPHTGKWEGAGFYAPNQSMTTVMQKMGGKKLLSLEINTSNDVTGSMVVTYDKSKATIPNNGGDQLFTVAGKYDINRQLLLLILTHVKMGAIQAAFKKPDSIYYSINLSVNDSKLVMSGNTGKANNRNATAEWVGSSEGQGMGMNILDNVGMHMLPLSIKLESDKRMQLAPRTIDVPDVLPGITVTNVEKRKIEIQRTILLDTSFIKLDLYDNSEIDGDIATLILDGKTILSNQLLSAKAATLSLNLSKDISEHVLELFANNLGTIPPNTALLVLTCNRKRYEITLSSNGTVNGSVRLIFKSN